MALQFISEPTSPQELTVGETLKLPWSVGGVISSIGYGFQDIAPYTQDPTYSLVNIFPSSQTEALISIESGTGIYGVSVSQDILYSGGSFSLSYDMEYVSGIPDTWFGLSDSEEYDYNGSICHTILHGLGNWCSCRLFGVFSGTLLRNSGVVSTVVTYDGIDTATITLSDDGGMLYTSTQTVDASFINYLRFIGMLYGNSGDSTSVTNLNFVVDYGVGYSLTLDSVEIDSLTTTDTTYTYTKTAEETDTGDYQLSVTNAGTTITSDVSVIVSEGVSIYPIDSFSVVLNLAMKIKKGWNDTVNIFDWGSTADTYTATAKYLTLGYSIWDTPISNDNSVIVSEDGLLPFGSHFSGNQYGYRYPKYEGKADFHGEYHLWNVEIIPDSSSGYTYDTSVYSPCTVTGFAFDGINNIPMPVCTPQSEYNIVYNRSGKVVREYDYGIDAVERIFAMEWSGITNEELRIILIRILTNIRGNEFYVNFYDGYDRFSPWQPRDGEPTAGTQKLRLYSPVIEYTYSSGFWSLKIEVMKWQ